MTESRRARDNDPELVGTLPLEEATALLGGQDETGRAWRRYPAAPAPLTAFIGREQLSDALSALLVTGPDRLLTLIGPGGVGKTRLLHHLLQRVTPAFFGSTAFVSMAAVEEPDLVLPAIVHALGLPPSQSMEPAGQLEQFLSSSHGRN